MKQPIVLLCLGLLTFPGCGGVTPEGPDPYECCPPADSDWPQWRGLARDGHAGAARLADAWPEGGPEELWRKPIGSGFAAVSVRGSSLFAAYTDAGEEALFHLDADSGEERWRLSLGDAFQEEYGDGPRAAPTLHGDVVLALGSRGRLVAARIGDGSLLWSAELHPGGPLGRGYASSPLVEGRLVIVGASVGGGPAFVALDRADGSLVWSAEKGRSAASSPVALTLSGERQVVGAYGHGLVGLDPRDGRRLWRYPWPTQYGLNIATPVFSPPDGVLISAGYDQGSALVRPRQDPDWRVEEAWTNRQFRNHFATSVRQDSHFYGFDNSILKCVDAATGEERWRARGYGKGSLIVADRKLIVLAEDGDLAMVRAAPGGHQELARAQVLDGKCWTAPTLAGERLFVRNHEQLVALRLPAPPEP